MKRGLTALAKYLANTTHCSFRPGEELLHSALAKAGTEENRTIGKEKKPEQNEKEQTKNPNCQLTNYATCTLGCKAVAMVSRKRIFQGDVAMESNRFEMNQKGRFVRSKRKEEKERQCGRIALPASGQVRSVGRGGNTCQDVRAPGIGMS